MDRTKSNPGYEYTRVQEDDIPDHNSRNAAGRRVKSLLPVFIFSTFVASLVTFLVTRQMYLTASPMEMPIKHCGNSTTEARSLGCTFDPLAISWLPAECPRDMTEEFLEFPGPDVKWHYWLDKEGNQEVKDYNTLSEMEWYWSTNREHMTHCAFMIMRLHRVIERGGRPDTLSMDFHHTRHCLMAFLSLSEANENFNLIGTLGDVRFGSC